MLCPAFIPTGIAHSARKRSVTAAGATRGAEEEAKEGLGAGGGDDDLAKATKRANKKYAMGLLQAVQSGKKTADEIAEHVFASMDKGDFYIIPHKKILGAVTMRYDDIQNLRQPTSVVPGA